MFSSGQPPPWALSCVCVSPLSSWYPLSCSSPPAGAGSPPQALTPHSHVTPPGTSPVCFLAPAQFLRGKKLCHIFRGSKTCREKSGMGDTSEGGPISPARDSSWCSHALTCPLPYLAGRPQTQGGRVLLGIHREENSCVRGSPMGRTRCSCRRTGRQAEGWSRVERRGWGHAFPR